MNVNGTESFYIVFMLSEKHISEQTFKALLILLRLLWEEGGKLMNNLRTRFMMILTLLVFLIHKTILSLVKCISLHTASHSHNHLTKTAYTYLPQDNFVSTYLLKFITLLFIQHVLVNSVNYIRLVLTSQKDYVSKKHEFYSKFLIMN